MSPTRSAIDSCSRARVVGQRRAGDQLHHQMRWNGTVARMKGVDLRDARMLQPAEHLGFVLEAPEDVGMAEAAAEHFDRDRASRPILLRRVHDAHAAGPERVQHQKAAEVRAGLQRAVDRRHVERRNPARDRGSPRRARRARRPAPRPRARSARSPPQRASRNASRSRGSTSASARKIASAAGSVTAVARRADRPADRARDTATRARTSIRS